MKKYKLLESLLIMCFLGQTQRVFNIKKCVCEPQNIILTPQNAICTPNKSKCCHETYSMLSRFDKNLSKWKADVPNRFLSVRTPETFNEYRPRKWKYGMYYFKSHFGHFFPQKSLKIVFWDPKLKKFRSQIHFFFHCTSLPWVNEKI